MRMFREFIKLLMFLFAWSMPCALAIYRDNNNFLWLFIISMLLTFEIFGHFTAMSRYENQQKEDGRTEED